MNIQALMAQAKKMQADLEKSKAELAQKEITVSKQGVEIVVYGNRQVKSIKINEALIDPDDKEIIEDLMIVAFNEAMTQIDALTEEMMPKQGGGLPF